MIKINRLVKSDFLSFIKVKKIIDECVKYVFDNTINTNNQYKQTPLFFNFWPESVLYFFIFFNLILFLNFT